MAIQHGITQSQLKKIPMNPNKSHITQITRRDLEEIARAANSYGGDGINVLKKDEGLEISIDKIQLERWIKVVVNGGHLQ